MLCFDKESLDEYETLIFYDIRLRKLKNEYQSLICLEDILNIDENYYLATDSKGYLYFWEV